MIRYREGIDILAMLGACGFTTYELRKQHIFGQATIAKLRAGGLPSWNELNTICNIINYDVGELIEFVRDI